MRMRRHAETEVLAAAPVVEIVPALPPGAGVGPVACRASAPAPAINGEEARVLGHLEGDSLSLDELGRLTGLDMGCLSLIMFGLEIKELVYAVPGQRYAKKNFWKDEKDREGGKRL